MDWNIVWAVLVSFGVFIGISLALWQSVQKGIKDYKTCVEDEVWTDEEKIKFADDILQIIHEAKDAITGLVKIVALLKRK
jgi:hypothetical protein